MTSPDATPTVFVAGHRGMVGSAIVRRLHARGYRNILTAGRDAVDLTRRGVVEACFRGHRIDQVGRASGWLEAEVQAWIDAQIAASRRPAANDCSCALARSFERHP